MTASAGRPRLGFSQVAISGVAARLPGANNEDEFWSLLNDGRCAVAELPEGRWGSQRYFHPRVSEPGFSYSFAGGYLSNPFDFDPSVFGISPREAAEMDPQQRLLLEVVWSALEDAGIPPSALAGSEVGVYVGASSLDYGNLHTTDPASIDSHFMTGNTLSVLSNRISYIFDLKGPSFTVDTACSSSLVAFAEAQAAIASGRIDMAIVAGVNMLLSPMSFIGFARASMLSPTGLCRPFSAQGDGYVRAEGAVAMVLARLSTAMRRRYPVRAVALASGTNSDGRTAGISLPSMQGQRALLDQIYAHPVNDPAIDPNRLAFVEAHGTGTRVGDPAEATAIGEALGQVRHRPLPIGSVKSNIGHLEPASGLAGLYKAILALEHRHLPRTLHAAEINPAIDFAALNLSLATQPLALPAEGTWLAGVSSFGFGGTNAHVVIRQAETTERPMALGDSGDRASLLVLTAPSRPALAATACAYADAIAAGGQGGQLANAVAWQRDMSVHRLALPLDDPTRLVANLRDFAATGDAGPGFAAAAPSTPPKLCFVFSGNGCQWPGMGRAAFAANAAFRAKFAAIDKVFGRCADWSLVDALHAPNLADNLKQTRVAQPLLFALQSALVAGLDAIGLKPDMVLGHSVGEVAAAEAAGALSLAEAVHVIFHRSEHQEKVHGLGTMAVANLPADQAEALIAEYPGIEIAAINSPNSVTLSGPEDLILCVAKVARKRRVAFRVLDLAYPFHSSVLEPLRLPLLASLGPVAAKNGNVPFLSTVTGAGIAGARLDGDYWWRNVREPVRFQEAIATAAGQGAGLFIEIGPRPILANNVTDSLRDIGADGTIIASLSDKEKANESADPLLSIAARALALGCKFDTPRLFGEAPTARVKLPGLAWQRKFFRQPQSAEALDIYGVAPRHPLIGARLSSGTPEWRSLIDSTVLPYLADHRIDGEMVMPGAAFAEMALAVAREIFPDGPIGLEDFDLLQWLPLRADAMHELSIRWSGDTQLVEIWSRPRLGADEWSLCARGRIVRIASSAPAFVPKQTLPHAMTGDQVYASAAHAGIDYGPSFRRVVGAERSDTVIEIELAPIADPSSAGGRAYILHPIVLDAAFHAMFENIKPRSGERYAYLPVRFAALRVDRDGGLATRARVVVDRETDQSLSISVALYDADDRFVAGLTGGLFRSITFDRRKQAGVFYHQSKIRLTRDDDRATARTLAVGCCDDPSAEARPESWLILEAFARSLAFERLQLLFGDRAVARDTALLGDQRAWTRIVNLFDHLRRAGLASETDQGWVLAAESGLPDPAEILQTFAAEYSGASAEIVLAAQALDSLHRSLGDGAPPEIRPAILEQFESNSILFAPLVNRALAVCRVLQRRIAPEPLRVLVAEPFCLGLLRGLTPLALQGLVCVTVVGTDGKRLAHTEARRSPRAGIRFEAIEADGEAPAFFDLALAVAAGPLFGGDSRLGRAMARRLAPGGLFCALQPPDNAVFDLLLGDSDGWFSESQDPNFPLGRIGAAEAAPRHLVAAGFTAIETCSLGDDLGEIHFAEADRRAHPLAVSTAPVLLFDDRLPLLAALARALRGDGRTIKDLPPGRIRDFGRIWPEAVASGPAGQAVDIIFPAFSAEAGGLDASIAGLRAILTTAESCRLWIIVRGLAGENEAAIDPLAEAVWCFARVAINEYPGIDIKLVDIALPLDPEIAAQRLAALVAEPVAESELLIDSWGVSALRTLSGSGRAPAEQVVPAVRLELSAKGMLANFDWVEGGRSAPGKGEVEVAIEASGLNFRDIMLATGLLDDDVLDSGLAGAVFGFECAGRVVAVGAGVDDLAVGDPVMGFGRHSFASYSTADSRVFTKIPEGLPTEAAATIPVAFLTAWYALVQLAAIQPGEWVLIHGAAGGVGLAALQIAKLRGARVAATVSTADKRAVVALWGAERIYNSRSVAFHDQIREEIGGVDVVLNSLAGEAMLASVKCLKPFGRFVELGKRDYVLNTALGLRPFRRNLSYFGVDLDQLLAANLPLAQKLMATLAAHFANGDLTPLPYRAFDWFDAGDAFQLMQSAGHVGKLVVRPATPPIATCFSSPPFKAGAGVHLVVGGTGGFGFETAAWLAEKGAEVIVVASRRGMLDPALAARAAAIERSGARLIAVSLDVTDRAQLDALIATLIRQHGRLAGVIHAAMVLDDGVIAGMTPERTRAVLAPKVEGADNLDRATRGAALDYFVVYASATTMIGNPGQGAYVAANGYLQGLMRARRAAGLPGLAVAWGAIGDVGVLARNRDVAAALERISGIVAMPAREALSHLEGLLTQGCPPSVICASFRPGAALQSLKLLSTPAFGHLFATAGGGDSDPIIDLAGQIAGKSEIEARAFVAERVALEVARILRLSADEIDAGRPLDELGMDSLMSLELRMSIENRFGIELPVVAISAGITVNDLATRLIAGLAGGDRSPLSTAGDLERQLMQQHAPSDIGLDDLVAVTDASLERRSTMAALL